MESPESVRSEAFHELLSTLTRSLDVREIFRHLSTIAKRIIPHDEANLALAVEDGAAFRLYASTGDCAPEVIRVGEHHAVTDPSEPRIFKADAAHKCPFETGIRVPVLVDTQLIGVLVFLSRQPVTYSDQDLLLAQRVAEYVAVGLSHQRLAEAERQAAEDRARAERLEARVKLLADELDAKSGVRLALGHSALWKDALKKAAQVASTETTALLQGESGTGKEVVARFIHRASPRKAGPFVAINCAALPEQLLESELFGYERGAFTGAQQSKPGQIELAAGGVLFLDEVSEMSPSAQAKFLRVLQEREFQRLGGTRPLKANVRVIAATNRDLRKAVENGTFREDLYYRLKVFDIALPPLRDRRGDVLMLADAFLDEIAKSFGRPRVGLTPDAKDALIAYQWPGNVRELRNALERAAILSDGGSITKEHLALPEKRPSDRIGTTDLHVVERQTIQQVMRDTSWNKSRAARRLGLSRTQLYVRLRRYDLEKPTYS